MALAGQLLGDQGADSARADDGDISRRIAIGEYGRFHHSTFGKLTGTRVTQAAD